MIDFKFDIRYSLEVSYRYSKFTCYSHFILALGMKNHQIMLVQKVTDELLLSRFNTPPIFLKKMVRCLHFARIMVFIQ